MAQGATLLLCEHGDPSLVPWTHIKNKQKNKNTSLGLYTCNSSPGDVEPRRPLGLMEGDWERPLRRGLNALVINSEPPIMHWCRIEERNVLPPWSHLGKSRFRLEFSTSYSLCPVLHLWCESASAPDWRQSCDYVPVSVPVWTVCVCLHMSVSVCLVFHKGLCSVFVEQHRNHHVGKEWCTLQKSLIEL